MTSRSALHYLLKLWQGFRGPEAVKPLKVFRGSEALEL
ncbi:hypothetical protein A2U01_0067582, partial [Trifolium medium]|nr:hypothetical protein [Trifolium medium]